MWKQEQQEQDLIQYYAEGKRKADLLFLQLSYSKVFKEVVACAIQDAEHIQMKR